MKRSHLNPSSRPFGFLCVGVQHNARPNIEAGKGADCEHVEGRGRSQEIENAKVFLFGGDTLKQRGKRITIPSQ